jgi:hypothetical protein
MEEGEKVAEEVAKQRGMGEAMRHSVRREGLGCDTRLVPGEFAAHELRRERGNSHMRASHGGWPIGSCELRNGGWVS